MNKAYDISAVGHTTSEPLSIRHLSRHKTTSEPSTYDISTVTIRHLSRYKTTSLPWADGSDAVTAWILRKDLSAAIYQYGFLVWFLQYDLQQHSQHVAPCGRDGSRGRSHRREARTKTRTKPERLYGKT